MYQEQAPNTSLQQAIEALYAAFAYGSLSDMQHCDCGCINEADVKKLASKPLRQLEYEHLISYHGSALYTWGEVAHYQFFLPRILELHSLHRRWPEIDLSEIKVKLELAEWTSWSSEEQEAIQGFLREDWKAYLQDASVGIEPATVDGYMSIMGWSKLLELWSIEASGLGIRKFVNYFYNEGSTLLKNMAEQDSLGPLEVFIQYITANDLMAKLEEEFFQVPTSEADYAERVSVVQQMLAQELRIANDPA